MKITKTNLFTKLMMGAAIAVATLSSNAAAQDFSRRHVEVNFDFTAGTTQLPAGKYTIEPLNNDRAQRLLVIRNQKTNQQAIVTVTNTTRPMAIKNAALTFNRYGNQVFLSQINMGESKFAVLRSKTERDVEKTFIAQAKAQEQTGEVRD